MWFVGSLFDSHNHLQIFLMFCQVLDPLPCGHAEWPIMVIYVLGELMSPIPLGSFISMEGWSRQDWLPQGAARTRLSCKSLGGLGRQTEFKGTQLRNGSELSNRHFILLPSATPSPQAGVLSSSLSWSFYGPFLASLLFCVFNCSHFPEWGPGSAWFREEFASPLCFVP